MLDFCLEVLFPCTSKMLPILWRCWGMRVAAVLSLRRCSVLTYWLTILGLSWIRPWLSTRRVPLIKVKGRLLYFLWFRTGPKKRGKTPSFWIGFLFHFQESCCWSWYFELRICWPCTFMWVLPMQSDWKAVLFSCPYWTKWERLPPRGKTEDGVYNFVPPGWK